MSNITSSSYPVVTVSQSGDQFAIVQNGQLKKLTRQGLGDYISKLAPNTFIALTDAPGSFVGQAGKAVVVKNTEDGVEFQPATSGNFLALVDTPSAYGGQAGRLPVVNNAETALEFIDNSLIKLADTPTSYSGNGKKILRVNVGATATEFVSPADAAPAANFTGGFFDYNHGGSTQSYTAGSGFVTLNNDETGGFTNKQYPPPGVTDLWNATANQFEWSELSLGDMVDLRLDIDVTTTTANQQIDVDLFLAIGGSAYQIPFIQNTFKAAGTYKANRFNGIYMGDSNTLDNPAEFRFQSDADATITVNGWYVKAIRRGAV